MDSYLIIRLPSTGSPIVDLGPISIAEAYVALRMAANHLEARLDADSEEVEVVRDGD